MPQCSIEVCEGAVYIKGYCRKHYTKLMTYGDANYYRIPATHPLHKTWVAMNQRCSNPNTISYPLYGAKGITVCERWQGKMGFTNFIEDMGDKPTPKHTLDRIDGNGDYEPSNCRWATTWEQVLNKKSTTNHAGVSFLKKGVDIHWKAHMTFEAKPVLNQSFKTYKEAITARQAAELKYLGVILQPEAANLELDKL